MRSAFSDESQRGNTYVVASVIVGTTGVRQVRAELRRFLRSNQRRIHMTKESPSRRNQFLTLVTDLVDGAVVVEAPIGPRSLIEVRERVMQEMARCLAEADVTTWHIEKMVDVIEARDRRAIAAGLEQVDPPRELTYDHRPPHTEPLLWAADAVAWAASRQKLSWVTTVELP